MQRAQVRSPGILNTWVALWRHVMRGSPSTCGWQKLESSNSRHRSHRGWFIRPIGSPNENYHTSASTCTNRVTGWELKCNIWVASKGPEGDSGVAEWVVFWIGSTGITREEVMEEITGHCGCDDRFRWSSRRGRHLICVDLGESWALPCNTRV
jgi:hypothetical protein